MNKKWLPCELHCHTVHSDGDFTVKELLSTAEKRLLRGICITDHNTCSAYDELPHNTPLAVLRGIEWTTYFGHMPILGCREYIDWRDALPDSIDSKLKAVHKAEGIAGIAHPYQLGTPLCTGGHWDYNIRDYSLVSYMEIWSEGEALMTPPNIKARKKWLSLLSQGYRIAPTFGRDWHRAERNRLTGACTYLLIEGEITGEKMKTAISEGRTQISLSPALYVETEKGETLGDTIEPGAVCLKLFLDEERGKSFEREYCCQVERLRVITENDSCILEEAYENKSLSLSLRENSFYIFELWGKVGDMENQLITLTAPIYTKEKTI